MTISLSKLSSKCKKCPNVKNCNNKRMEACALAEIPKLSTMNATNNTTMPLTQPILRTEHPVTINMGEYGSIDTSLEEIAEKLKKDFYKNLNCSFNR